MRHSKVQGSALAALAAFLIVCGCHAIQNTPASPEKPDAAARLAPGASDGRVAYLTARLLEEYHYSQQPLDTAMSGKIFDLYVGGMGGLDPRHENFLKSDLDEFSHWRTNLDVLTVNSRQMADLTPAFEIFQRYLERLSQHTAYVDELLKEDKFKFNGNDRFLIDRRHAPFPKNLDEARQIWRDRVRYEYLQDKLSREISPTNGAVVSLPKSAGAEITDKLARHYRWSLQMTTNWDRRDVLQCYLDSLAHAFDPHSDYLNTEHAEDFSINMSLSLFGIGAQLGEDDGYCRIGSLIRGGPADKSKQLKEGDYIVAVAQGNKAPVDVVDMHLDRVVQLIRGAKGTQVRLTISPAEDRSIRRIITLTRDEIKLEDQESKAQLIEMPGHQGRTNRIGIVTVPSFYAPIDLPGNEGHTSLKYMSADVNRLVEKLKQQKVAGIIIDLRSNPGGSLEEAVKFTGLFIKDGPVVQARDSDGKIVGDSDTDPSIIYDGPLIILVNRFSASAAEIAAAALQDYGRALVVGDVSTHGKGTVQNLNPLRPFISSASNDPGTVKITIRKFYRVTGASTQLKGVASDIILPDVLNDLTEIGETALDNPLPWDTIPGTNYSNMDLVRPYLAELSRQSAARVATNQDFIYTRQDIEQFQKFQAGKTATLNEHEALKEHERIDAQNKARDAEREARKAPNEKIYDLTVENAGEAGLPAPERLPLTVTNVVVTNAKTNIEVKPLPPDPALQETENILEDYISALSAKRTLIAN